MNQLGSPRLSFFGSSLVWETVCYEDIKELLFDKFIFQKRARVFNELEHFSQWVTALKQEHLIEDWNVIVSGNGKVDELDDQSKWDFGLGQVGKISRSKKSSDSDVINIGVLGVPRDLISDIPNAILEKEDSKRLTTTLKKPEIKELRNKGSVDRNPLLIIYRIDKDSKPKGKDRVALNADSDIIGLQMYMPGVSRNGRAVNSVTINLDPSRHNAEEDEE